MVGRIVYKRFDGHGVCRGTVKSYADAEDMHNEWPWCIGWDDAGVGYFNAEEMYDYGFTYKDGLPSAETDHSSPLISEGCCRGGAGRGRNRHVSSWAGEQP